MFFSSNLYLGCPFFWNELAVKLKLLCFCSKLLYEIVNYFLERQYFLDKQYKK